MSAENRSNEGQEYQHFLPYQGLSIMVEAVDYQESQSQLNLQQQDFPFNYNNINNDIQFIQQPPQHQQQQYVMIQSAAPQSFNNAIPNPGEYIKC